MLLVTALIYLLGLATVTLAPTHASRARKAELRAEPTAGIELVANTASLTCSSGRRAGVSNNRGFCMNNAAGNVCSSSHSASSSPWSSRVFAS